MSQRYLGGFITASYNPLLVPNAPTIGTATAGVNQLSVTFTAPTNVGGSAITSYTARARDSSSGATFSTSGSSSPIVIAGLTPGNTYTVTIVAINLYGTGPASAASNSVVPIAPTLVSDVFSTALYTGTGSTQNITNGINLTSRGGLVWIKSRTSVGQAWNHSLTDTVRGNGSRLYSNRTDAENAAGTPNGFTYNNNGFTVGVSDGTVNNASNNYASWTFAENPKFFDAVTYTGNGSNSRQIDSSLSGVSEVGFAIVKRLDTSSDWWVNHLNTPFGTTGKLNTGDPWSSSGGTLTYALLLNTSAAGNFALGSICINYFGYGPALNVNGATYVAYFFANNAGGFGPSSTDNAITCGPMTVSGNASSVTLGYRPQWVMFRRITGSDWFIVDSARGFTSAQSPLLRPNQIDAESANTGINANATGFTTSGILDNGDWIYVAVRQP
jgi:hypothetical protein